MNTPETGWVKFTWQLDQIPERDLPMLPAGYDLRIVGTGHFSELLQIVVGAYNTEPVWNKIIHEITIRMKERIGNTLGQAQNKYLAIFHTDQIVAVSGVCQYHWTNQNFLTGICVSKNHQRQGLGTYLLYNSLKTLHASGLTYASVYTETGSLADIKIYPLYQSKRIENVEYLSLSNPLYQLPVPNNIYYEGRVQSLAFESQTGYTTAGVIKPGTYQFSTSSKEIVKIISGTVEVQLPGKDWVTYGENDSYEVPAGFVFAVRTSIDVLYVCEYYK